MILPLKRYAQFEGRANRREYWMYQLFLFLVATAVMLLAGVLAILLRNSAEALAGILIGMVVLLCVMWLATIVPLIAGTGRRLHDCNQSGAGTGWRDRDHDLLAAAGHAAGERVWSGAYGAVMMHESSMARRYRGKEMKPAFCRLHLYLMVQSPKDR